MSVIYGRAIKVGGSGGGLSSAYYVGDTAPDDTNLLWIDTTANTGGLKYYNGTDWVHVPVAWV